MIEVSRSYCGPAPAADAWWGAWNGDPALIAVLAMGVAAALRLTPDRRRYGLAALGVLAVAFVSPLCALTTALFTARSVHHIVLLAVAAPLLALARPAGRGGVPVTLTAMTAMLWLWHVPAIYDRALSNIAFYWIMQLGLLGAGWSFWSATLRAPIPVAFAGLVGATAQMGLLGALLTFAPRPLYAAHLASTISYGIGPLRDQQLAGLVMWLPGMLPFALAAGWISARRWGALVRVAA
ncbi:cytochrome c oxidase assembly protein [Sphingomonas adhaesiva]|uniref:cytochrome c oxidase assembly protein n=1 Tax=Sphingomonas adhaesiva TaxID=28212 RepID=UPI002FFAC3B1